MMRLNSRIVARLQNPFVHGRNFHQFFRKDEQPNKTNGHLAFMSQRRMFRIDQKERNRPISVKTYCSLFPLSGLLKIRPAWLAQVAEHWTTALTLWTHITESTECQIQLRCKVIDISALIGQNLTSISK